MDLLKSKKLKMMQFDKNAVQKKEIEAKELKKRLNSHLLSFEGISIQEKNYLYYIHAVDLLTKDRMDIIFKYLYAKARALNLDSTLGKKLYIEHIQRLNGFFEGDGSGKIGREEFLNRFDHVIEEIYTNGFDCEKSVIPVDTNNIIIDGSHRVGASLINNELVPCTYFNDYRAFRYSLQNVREAGFDQNVLDLLALEYAKLKENTYIVTIFPVGKGKEHEISQILSKYSTIIYQKKIRFSTREDTYTALIKEIYFKDNWTGNWQNKFKGARLKGKACFKIQGKTQVFLVESNGNESLKSAKLEIRKLFNGLQDCIHINDDHEETIRLSQIYFNENSVHLFNNINLVEDMSFERLLNTFKRWVIHRNLSFDDFCVDGSGVMSVYGIRKANDLDIIHHDSIELTIPNHEINSHNLEARFHACGLDELIVEPRNHLYYSGIKFISLPALKTMKESRSEEKDIEDTNLINKVLGLKYNWKVLVIFKLRSFFQVSRILSLKIKIKQKSKKILNRLIQLCLYKPKLSLLLFLDKFKPFIRTIKYHQFEVFYSQGTSLIEINGNPPVRIGGIYEKKESLVLTNWLKLIQSKEPIMIDIGANIGLFSLNILSSVPTIKIHAFEPGEHQAMLLSKTIQKNNLQERLILYKLALGNKSGKTKFYIHDSSDCSGDGFIDTLRSGKTYPIEVIQETLDSWWKKENCIEIDVIKIDTEGAELLVLQGGMEMIKACRPKILLEINSANLKSYPYGVDEIIDWFQSQSYALKDLSGIPINSDNYKKILLNNEMFQATPLEN